MDDIEFIKKIETEYDVKSIIVDDVQIWPILRISYSFAYLNKYILNNNSQESISWSNKLSRIKNIFYDFRNLIRHYDYLIFSDTMELRLIENKYFNKLTHSIIKILGENNTLLVENPILRYNLKLSQRINKNIMSLDIFRFFYFLSFNFKKIIIYNEDILLEINKKFDLDINYFKILKKFLIYRSIFTLFLKIYKPKLIFITEYYSLIHQTLIYSSKSMGIKTVELQHGSIDGNHPAYNVFTNLDKSFFPDFLFVFGDNTTKIFDKNNFFINKKNVFAIGNMYIDFINNEYKPSSKIYFEFKKLRERYKKIIAVSSQITIEDELITFLKKSALLSPNVLFILVPRNFEKDYTAYSFSENIILLKDLDVYQTIKLSDFHSTVYSTCAIEAPALGIPNIMINIHNLSKKYYSRILTNSDVTKFADTPEEFVKLIGKWKPKSKDEIKQLHERFYAKNHKESLKKALDIIFKENKINM